MTDVKEPVIDQQEWQLRFQQRLIDVARVTPAQAQAEFDGAGFEYLSNGYEDDTEGSAEEVMSYWEP